MWRDSFAVPRYVADTSRPFAASIEDDYLLQVERQANHLRRKDTSSFIPCDEEASAAPYQRALYRQIEEEEDSKNVETKYHDEENLDLLARTPVDSSLPTVEGFFQDKKQSTLEEYTTIFNSNPMLSEPPPGRASLRKAGSLVNFLLKARKPNEEEKVDDPEDRDSKSTVNPRFAYSNSTKLNKAASDESQEASESTSNSTLASYDRPSTSRNDDGGSEVSPQRPTLVRSRSKVGLALKKSLSFVTRGKKNDE